jgi:hypothetical protein
VVSVPEETACVSSCPSEHAAAIIDSIAFIALLTNAHILIEQLALRADLAAHSFRVEEVVLRAPEAGVTIPLGAPEVVVQHSQKARVGLNQSLQLCGGSRKDSLGEDTRKEDK